MKQNLYFKIVYQGARTWDSYAVTKLLLVLSFPRTLLEVFIRKNMGERYFSFFQAIILILGLGYIAYIYAPMFYFQEAQENFHAYLRENSYMYNDSSPYRTDFSDGFAYFFIIHFGSWVLFLVAFLLVSVQRLREIKRHPSVFDMSKFTFYSGDVHPFFLEFKWNNKQLDIRQIETILEPLFFLIIGLALILLQQYIGYIIVISSFGYWYNAHITYARGDQFVMDWIDTQILNQEKEKAFVKDDEVNNTHGVRYLGRKPADPETRRKMANDFSQDEIAVVN